MQETRTEDSIELMAAENEEPKKEEDPLILLKALHSENSQGIPIFIDDVSLPTKEFSFENLNTKTCGSTTGLE